jgi:hypothetical protein
MADTANSKPISETPTADRAPTAKPDKAPWLKEHRWKPGQSGNPNGRPRRKPITEMYLKMLDEKAPFDPKGRTFRELMCLGQMKAAIQGKPEAMKEITNRLEGAVGRGEDDTPSTFVVNIIQRDPKPAEAKDEDED